MEKWQEYIESDPKILKGKPRIKNSRIPVSLILGYLASDYNFDEIIEEFPELTKKEISACLSYPRDLTEFEISA